MNFKFLFSQDFDSQKQNFFLYSFKNKPYFEDNASFESFKDIYEYDNGTYSLNFTISVAKNIKEIKEISKSYESFSCGIVFDSLTKYSIYIPYDSSFISYLYSSYYYTTLFNWNNLNDFYNIQALIDNAIYKTLTNSTNSKNLHIFTKLMDSEKPLIIMTSPSSYNEIIVLMIFLFTPCSLALLNHLVIEKESKIKESLLIIGLKNSNFWLSWAIIYGFIILINSIIVTIILNHFEIMSFIRWSVILVIIIIYGLSCCCLYILFIY